jgi:hypothetical protein
MSSICFIVYVYTAESSSKCDKKGSHSDMDDELVGPPRIEQGICSATLVLCPAPFHTCGEK